jgi:hypothetical protein
MRHGKRLLTLTAALALGAGAMLGIAAPASAATVQPAFYDWQYGGRYQDTYDCTESGLEFMDGGSGRVYRCLEEVDSGGSTAYYNLCLGYWVGNASVEARPMASNPCAGL